MGLATVAGALRRPSAPCPQVSSSEAASRSPQAQIGREKSGQVPQLLSTLELTIACTIAGITGAFVQEGNGDHGPLCAIGPREEIAAVTRIRNGCLAPVTDDRGTGEVLVKLNNERHRGPFMWMTT